MVAFLRCHCLHQTSHASPCVNQPLWPVYLSCHDCPRTMLLSRQKMKPPLPGPQLHDCLRTRMARIKGLCTCPLTRGMRLNPRLYYQPANVLLAGEVENHGLCAYPYSYMVVVLSLTSQLVAPIRTWISLGCQ
jgi:hypothetical protein